MDIATGLSMLAQATKLAKDLREIDKEFDRAAIRAKMADLYATLADVRMALTDAREEIHERDQRIKELEGDLKSAKSGERCPICEEGSLKIRSSRAHPQFAFAGVQLRTLACTNCDHQENRNHQTK